MELEGVFFDTKDYKLLDQTLGEGAFGSVYIAENINNKQQYAAKIINPDTEFDGQEQIQFLHESSLLHKLDHPSIAKFLGINFKSLKDPKKLELTIISEYFPQGTLKANLNKERKSLADLNWNPTKKYISLLGISDAMRYLHQNGIIHRNLKPENIFIDSNYYPRVCDFGLSSCFPDTMSNLIKLTISGQLGSPIYLAPEILNGEDIFDFSADVYAFGILAYEIVTGKVSYNELGEKNSPSKLIEKVTSGYRPKFPENVPEKMQNLIKK